MNAATIMLNKDTWETLVIIGGFIGGIWSIASLKESILDKIQELDKKVDLHIQSSLNARSNLEEKIYGQGKRFGAKFDRLESRVNDVIDYKIIITKLDQAIDKE